MQKGKVKNQTKIFQIKILDQLGHVRKQQRYPSGITSTMINTSGLVAGVYIIRAYNGETWETTRFVKQ